MHKFCAVCLEKYCSYKIGVMEEITCPEENCSENIDLKGSVFEELPKTAQ